MDGLEIVLGGEAAGGRHDILAAASAAAPAERLGQRSVGPIVEADVVPADRDDGGERLAVVLAEAIEDAGPGRLAAS